MKSKRSDTQRQHKESHILYTVGHMTIKHCQVIYISRLMLWHNAGG